MAKFCGKCGTELKDEKCPKCGEKSKNEAVATTTVAENKFIELLKGAFKKPVTTAIEESEDKNFGLAWIIMGITAIACGIFSMAYSKAAADAVMSPCGIYGYSSEPEYLKILLVAALAYLLVVNMLIGFMALFFNKVFKIELSYKKIFMAYQFSGIMTIIGLLAGAIFAFINVSLGAGIIAVGLILTNFTMITAFAKLVDKKNDYLGYAYALSLGCTYLALWIVGTILA